MKKRLTAKGLIFVETKAKISCPRSQIVTVFNWLIAIYVRSKHVHGYQCAMLHHIFESGINGLPSNTFNHQLQTTCTISFVSFGAF